jgi:hypothetical protein
MNARGRQPTFMSAALIRRKSAGMRSPDLTKTRSPTTSRRAYRTSRIFRNLPRLRTTTSRMHAAGYLNLADFAIADHL